MTRIPSKLCLYSLGLFAAACATGNRTADLANNDVLYTDVPFHTKAPGDRDLFVAPITDARDAVVLPVQEGGFPIGYGSDDFWERPVGEMLADVLVRQLEGSGLFASVVDAASPQTLILQPTLITFVTGAKEAMSGTRSFAEVGLRLSVLGPSGADGARPTLWEQTFGNVQMSEIGIHPPSPYRLVGRALQQTMQKALAGLDGSNVGRANVPIHAPTVSEATTKRN